MSVKNRELSESALADEFSRFSERRRFLVNFQQRRPFFANFLWVVAKESWRTKSITSQQEILMLTYMYPLY